MQQNLKLSEEQLSNLFLLRRAYLQKQAVILSYQHDLQRQHQSDLQEGESRLQPVQYIHQMQGFSMQLSEAFMHFMGGLYTRVRPATQGTELTCVVTACVFWCILHLVSAVLWSPCT